MCVCVCAYNPWVCACVYVCVCVCVRVPCTKVHCILSIMFCYMRVCINRVGWNCVYNNVYMVFGRDIRFFPTGILSI